MKKEKWLVPSLLLILWCIFSISGLMNEFFFASPWETASRIYQLTISGEILKDLGWTLLRVFLGLTIGSVLGLSFGITIGMSSLLWRYLESTVDFFRSLPAFALFPFFILAFGPGDTAKIATTAWFVSFVMLIASVYAIRHVSDTRIMTARSLGASRFQTFIYVTIPEGLPQLFVGFRTCLAFAPIVVVATEMFSGTQYGLGDRIYEARLLYNVSDMFAALLIAGGIGLCLNNLFIRFLEKRIHWARQTI